MQTAISFKREGLNYIFTAAVELTELSRDLHRYKTHRAYIPFKLQVSTFLCSVVSGSLHFVTKFPTPTDNVLQKSLLFSSK
jgi:hypothetical protein